MKNNFNILITSAGRRVSLVRFFSKELSNSKINGQVFTTDQMPKLAPACHVSAKSFKVPPVKDKNYIQYLKQLSLDNNIKLIIPTIDTELLPLAKAKSEFANLGITIAISTPEVIQICQNKKRTKKFFDKLNVSTPKTYSIKDLKNIDYPIFVKPISGSRSIGAKIINNYQEIRKEELENYENYLFSEYVNHHEYQEYTVDAYYSIEGKLITLVPRKRIEVRAGEISKGQTCKNHIIDIFKMKFSRLEGFMGCITFQLFSHKTTSDLKFIEINPRFGGGYPLSYHAGANFVRFLIEEVYYNKKLYFNNNWKNNLFMLRYDEEIIFEK